MINSIQWHHRREKIMIQAKIVNLMMLEWEFVCWERLLMNDVKSLFSLYQSLFRLTKWNLDSHTLRVQFSQTYWCRQSSEHDDVKVKICLLRKRVLMCNVESLFFLYWSLSRLTKWVSIFIHRAFNSRKYSDTNKNSVARKIVISTKVVMHAK